MAFGFFSKKEGKEPEGAEPAAEATALTPSPAKARTFFQRASEVHEAQNYEYAMTLWLQGIRMDPTSVDGLTNFAKSASAWLNERGKSKGPTKEQLATFSGKTAVDRYLRAVLEWGTRPLEWQMGLKAFEAAAKLKLTEPAVWLGSRVLGLAGEDPKAKKDSFVQLMQLFQELGAHDKAVVAGDIACRLDPSDGRLAAEVKNLAAQATITRSGFSDGSKVEAGSFRKNIREAEATRAKQEDEQIVKSEDAAARGIERAKADYESRPTDLGSIQKYARLLVERGTPEDEKVAYQVLVKGYEETGNFRFKQAAGDIRIRAARRKQRELREALAADPTSTEKQEALQKFDRQLQQLEIKEYDERVVNNPTDLMLRYELAKRCLEAGENERAIEHYQASRGAPGVLTQVLSGLGVAFARLGWLDEAESSFREALTAHPNQSDDLASDLRYGLMDVLERRARESSSLATAEEAFKLAAAIALQRINFRDIRARRQALQELVKTLRGTPG